MRFAGNDVVYAGDWQDSKRHGQGKLVFDKAQLCFYEGRMMGCLLPYSFPLHGPPPRLSTLLNLAATCPWHAEQEATVFAYPVCLPCLLPWNPPCYGDKQTSAASLPAHYKR